MGILLSFEIFYHFKQTLQKPATWVLFTTETLLVEAAGRQVADSSLSGVGWESQCEEALWPPAGGAGVAAAPEGDLTRAPARPAHVAFPWCVSKPLLWVNAGSKQGCVFPVTVSTRNADSTVGIVNV